LLKRDSRTPPGKRDTSLRGEGLTPKARSEKKGKREGKERHTHSLKGKT